MVLHQSRLTRGFTVIEVLVAFSALAVAILITYQVFGRSLQLSKVSERRFQAIALCQSLIEYARTIPPSQIPPYFFHAAAKEHEPASSYQTLELPKPSSSRIDSKSIRILWSDGVVFDGSYTYDDATQQIQVSSAARSGTVCIEYGLVVIPTVIAGTGLPLDRFTFRIAGRRFSPGDNSGFKLITATVSWDEGSRKSHESLELLRSDPSLEYSSNRDEQGEKP